MKRYEFSEGSSNKFWEIELEGKSFTTRYGKIGTDGQTTTKSFASAAEAEKQYRKIIAEKEKKGYEPVGTGGGRDDDGEDGEDGEERAEQASNPALEKVIDDNPDSSDGYLVYADWLSGQGDPHGELIAVEVALEKSPKDKALNDRANKLRKSHREAILGSLGEVEGSDLELGWRYGFLDEVRLGGDDEWAESDSSGAELLTELRRIRAGRFLRSLTIGLFNTDEGTLDYTDIIGILAEKGVPPTLRKLAFSCFGYQISWAELGKTPLPWNRLARLQELEIKFGSFNLGKIDAPELRAMKIVTGGFSKQNLKSVTSANVPKLERLALYFGMEDYGGDCTIKDVKTLLAGTNLPRVTDLGLCNAEFADDLPKALAGSPILARLARLDLSQGTLGEKGAQAIVDDAEAFAHLSSLDLRTSYITKKLCSALKKALPNADVADQQEPDGEDRYVQIGE